MIPYLLTGPAVEPLSLTEAKAWLRLDTNDEDDLVTALIVSARLIVESATRRALITQTWRLVYDMWPSSIVKIRLAPFQSIAGMRVYDTLGAATAIAPAAYILDASPTTARIIFPTSPPLPTRLSAGIEIDVVAGYGASASSVPEPLRQAIRMLAAHWFEARGDSGADPAIGHLPAAVEALVAPYRIARLA